MANPLHDSPAPPAAPETRARTSRARLFITALLLLLVLSVLGTWQILSARQHLLAGARDLQAARAGFADPAAWGNPSVRAQEVRRLTAARAAFGAAQSDLFLWRPLLEHLVWVPLAGGQMAAAPAAADAAYHTTETVLLILKGLDPAWPVLQHPGGKLFPRLAHAFEAGHSDFALAHSEAAGATTALAAIPRTTGNSALDSARTTLASRLPAIRAASAWLTQAPAILGMYTPRHYLVVVQDPTEIHATGGFIGAVDLVSARHAVLRHSFSSSIIPVQATSVPPPAPLGLYQDEGFWQFLYSNWSPDFPLAARSERWTYAKGSGIFVDGVINIQDTVMPSLLSSTGPVYLPSYRQTVTAGNVTALTQRYVNGSYHGPSSAGNPDTVRKQFLGALLQAMMRRVPTLSIVQWTSLGTSLAGAVARRDLMLYDRAPATEAAIRASGAGGSLRYSSGDFLSVVDTNLSDNKLNPYIREWGSYRVRLGAGMWADATLTLHYHVNPSPDGLEGFGPGGGSRGSKHDYEDFLRVYVPPGARLLSTGGLSRWAPAPAYGMTQLAGDFIVRQGTTRTVTFHYRIPANAFAASGFRRYDLTVRHQPASNLSRLAVSVQGKEGVRVADNSVPIQLDTGRDRSISLPVTGAVHPRTIRLPPPSANPDPYIQLSGARDGRQRF